MIFEAESAHGDHPRVWPLLPTGLGQRGDQPWQIVGGGQAVADEEQAQGGRRLRRAAVGRPRDDEAESNAGEVSRARRDQNVSFAPS